MSTCHWLGPTKDDELSLPLDLPNLEMNEIGYENGFDEALAIQSVSNGCFICTICHGIPRRPVILPSCGHLFCQACIVADVRSRNAEVFKNEVINNCPNCKGCFSQSAIKEFEAVDQWTQRVFKSLQLSCPDKCGFQGNSFEMDNHQSFECRKRKVKCPGVDCALTMTYESLKEDHIKKCPKVQIYCHKCKLPVRREKMASHDCLDRMSQALKGIIY